jgi:hypothetical protein
LLPYTIEKQARIGMFLTPALQQILGLHRQFYYNDLSFVFQLGSSMIGPTILQLHHALKNLPLLVYLISKLLLTSKYHYMP